MMTSSKVAGSTLSAFAVVLCSPAVAWLVWVSWSDGKPSDAGHVMWFATVALGCVVASAITNSRSSLPLVAALAAAATLVGLWLWWSSEDESGLFAIGVAIAAPLVVLASMPLVLLGYAIAGSGQRR